MADIDRWICDIQKNAREAFRFQLTEYRGYKLASIRVHYRSDGTDEMKPGKSGISIRVEKLTEFRDALEKAIAAAKSEGLVE